MPQRIEYPMYSPHDKAKLYKRYTADLPLELKNSEVVTIQNNQYVYAGTLRWVEATDKEQNDEQPIDGLIINNSYLTIKTNSVKSIEVGDIVELPPTSQHAGMWIVTDGIRYSYVSTPKQIQAYQYLPLSSL